MLAQVISQGCSHTSWAPRLSSIVFYFLNFCISYSTASSPSLTAQNLASTTCGASMLRRSGVAVMASKLHESTASQLHEPTASVLLGSGSRGIQAAGQHKRSIQTLNA